MNDPLVPNFILEESDLHLVPSNGSKIYIRVYYFALALLCIVGAMFIWRSITPPIATALVTVKDPLTSITSDESAWYWLAGSGTPRARIERCAGSSLQTVAAANNIREFAIGPGKIAWAAGKGIEWTISTSNRDGSGKSLLCAINREPRGLCISDGRVYWLEPVAAAVPDGGALPPLGATTRLMSAPVDGGPPTEIAGIMELMGQHVLGVHQGQVYVVATRVGLQDVTTIYRVPVAGGTTKRIAAEVGAQQALLTRDGTLLWTGPSTESTQISRVVAIRRLGANDKPDVVLDWLPGGGRFFETPKGVFYVDGTIVASPWKVEGTGLLPHASPIPPGYSTLAVKNGELLVQAAGVEKNIKLLTVSMR